MRVRRPCRARGGFSDRGRSSGARSVAPLSGQAVQCVERARDQDAQQGQQHQHREDGFRLEDLAREVEACTQPQLAHHHLGRDDEDDR
ncbi:MAG: hypothetical protein ACK559_34195, partial [bacterium]